MDEGEKIVITKTYRIGGVDWYYCYMESGDKTYSGYVHSKYVDIISSDKVNEDDFSDIFVDGAEIIGLIRVTGTKVHIREEDDRDSDSLGYAYEDDIFYYIDKEGSWYQISSGGWIHGDYVEKLDDEEAEDYMDAVLDDGPYDVGDTGSMVKWIQEALDSLGYYDGEITGHYGNKTKEAVRAFQNDYDLGRDGVAGGKTIAALREAYTGGSTSGSTGSGEVIKGNVIYSLNWFDYKSDLNSSDFKIKKKAEATLTYVKENGSLGQSFEIKIQSTGNHIDAEPLTAADTRVLCSIYGVSSPSQLNYKRRPFVLTTSTGKSVLVSMYPEEHGDDTIPSNNYDGQFCLHMVKSKTHGSDKVDDDHQTVLKKAKDVLVSAGYAVATGYPATTGNTEGTVVDKDTNVDSGVITKMSSLTYAYYLADSKYYHDNINCPGKVEHEAVNGPMKTGTYGQVSSRQLCSKCQSDYVFYAAEGWYHYKPDCTIMKTYDTIYKTTKKTAQNKGWVHTCEECKP